MVDTAREDDATGTKSERLGLIGLFRQLPGQISRLIRDELRAAQVELTDKLKSAGVGVGLLVGALVILLFAFGVLLAAAVLGLSTVFQPWAAALIVGGVLVIIAVVLALLGQKKLKKGVPPLPTESIENVKADLRAMKGANK
jgi:Flp pilus assembly protein TadB